MGDIQRSEAKLSLKLNEWGTFDGIGQGYAFKRDGRFYSILETKVGSYRGNHVHPNKQYTLLLSGKADYVLIYDGIEKIIPLKIGEVTVVEEGIPHIMVVHEDITTFEWWDGDFIAEPLSGLFKKYSTNNIGPEDFIDN
jgi:hypothetical protein